ncbi:DUF4388 domain-containing protein [Geomonas sp. RF6]|uniref:DUF4388 domain-containing protein n=1 Tax=Geomonas sp. RF6 TaxID=2897342 RepID=UPI001E63385F|nr:DUF4388 domain-containing protein [Geomonas sp. RF6]UFS71984.1 DUF4388 domain-containing protein [Geomonas sp. RF6]
MAFDGDLQSLPITDLIQLLHATGKSGTLTLTGPKGGSQLVFDGGYIVSANHVNNSMRIGRILVDMGALSQEELDRALKSQAHAGQKRAPLVAALVEAGTILPPQAYKGLEILIELTIVEVLTWSEGTFSFDVTKTFVSDEYRYFPEKLEQQIHLNTQSVLMDALRIYDERKRDGTLMDATFFCGEEPEAELSPEDLGLDALDELETTPPEPFHGLVDQEEPGVVRQRLRALLPGVPPEGVERLVAYLARLAPESSAADPCAVLLTGDALTGELVRAACADSLRGIAAKEEELPSLLEGGRRRIILLGAETASLGVAEVQKLLSRLCERFPSVEVYLLLAPGNHQLFASAVQGGICGVLPWPETDAVETVVEDLVATCEALRYIVRRGHPRQADPFPPHFMKLYRELVQLGTPAEITLSLLRCVAGFFPRAVTLVLLRGELVAEKGIGFRAPGAVSPLKLRIPLHVPSILRDATEQGEIFYGKGDDLVRESLSHFGAPSSDVLLLPVQSMGRVVALLYADWGDGPAADPQLSLLQIMAQHAGLVLDNALYRKRVAQHAAPRVA